MATIFRDYEEERRNKVIAEGTVNIYVGETVKTTSTIKKKKQTTKTCTVDCRKIFMHFIDWCVCELIQKIYMP